jgi:hypothetical protein
MCEQFHVAQERQHDVVVGGAQTTAQVSDQFLEAITPIPHRRPAVPRSRVAWIEARAARAEISDEPLEGRPVVSTMRVSAEPRREAVLELVGEELDG